MYLQSLATRSVGLARHALRMTGEAVGLAESSQKAKDAVTTTTVELSDSEDDSEKNVLQIEQSSSAQTNVMPGAFEAFKEGNDRSTVMQQQIPKSAIDTPEVGVEISKKHQEKSMKSPTIIDDQPHDNTGSGDEFDDHFERSHIAKFERIAQDHLARQDFKAAGRFFRSYLVKAKAQKDWDPDAIFRAKIRLVICENAQGDHAAAATELETIQDAKLSEEQHLSYCHHLATTHLLLSNLDLAERLAKRAVSGRRKLCGKTSSAYCDSISLLATILEVNDNPEEAEIYATYLPSDYEPNPLYAKERDVAIPWRDITIDGTTIEHLMSSTSPWQAAMAAVQHNKLEALEEILSQECIDIDATKAGDSETLLLNAVRRGFRCCAEVVLQHKPNVNAVSDSGQWRPVHLAAYSGYDALLRQLVTHGAAVDIADDSGSTPLSLAAGGGYTETVQFLVTKCETSLEKKGQFGDTALDDAIYDGHAEVVKILLAAGARLHAEKNLPTAASRGWAPILGLLLEAGANVDAQHPGGDTALHYAARSGSLPIAKSLLRVGADVNLANEFGIVPLMYAVMSNSLEITDLLLAHNATVDMKDQRGMTPLLGAVGGGKLSIANSLLRHGADINQITEDGSVPLLLALESDDGDMVALLLDAGGADLDIANGDGWSPRSAAMELHRQKAISPALFKLFGVNG